GPPGGGGGGGRPRGGASPPGPRAGAAARGGRAPRLVSVCTGGLLLAEAGLLDGRRATTHWYSCERMARDYPRVSVEPDPIYVRDGPVSTSAGVTAGIDLALALVEEDLGRDVALLIARHLVVFLRRPGNQAQFSAQLAAQTARREPLRDVQQWITEHPGGDLSVESLAARAALSPRHFARAFQAETGVTPGRYVERVRVEHARRLLEEGGEGVAQVARACGYRTPEALRRAFVRHLGQPPTEYRRRFGP
ncbi:GlxA family transcriptional regulator, partial [Streptomyces lavendulae]|uniref:GlxA family transcriptional regulator n=1 Tax=Streptomyces lavendulae TaxID=1914 RepID=UPI0036C176AB